MKRPVGRPGRVSAAPVLMAMVFLAPCPTRADTTYRIQPIIQLGGSVGNLKVDGHFDIGGLNDRGQIIFVTQDPDGNEVLLQYADGKLIPIVVGGADAAPLGGQWGTNNGVEGPVSMNQLGNVVFATDLTVGDDTEVETFLWDYQAQKVTTVARKGMPADQNRTLDTGGSATPSINNRNEIALVAAVRNAAGLAQEGVFLLGQDGKLQPVAVPDQKLPDGGTIVRADEANLNDAGVVAFLVRRQGNGAEMESAYVWENGTLTPVAVVGQNAPGGGKIAAVWRALVNNKNHSVLVMARLNNSKGPDALYRFADGKLTPVAVPGQPMPGGGKFKTIQSDREGIGFANELGQHPVLVMLEDRSTALYRLEPDGQLALVLKSGTATELGKITRVGVPVPADEPEGVGAGLNAGGQVAVSVQINGGVTTLVLLTPSTP
jgi:hypothetical protein